MWPRRSAVVAAVVCVTVVAAVGPFGFAGTARAATLVVDDDGADCPTAGHSTIQSAVDAASEGDTVEVCAGTYNETVIADVENLRLVATGAVLLDASAARATAISVRADGVWIEGFEIRNYTSNVIAIPNAGPSEGYHRTTITDNVVWISGPGAGVNTAGIVFQEAKSNNITVTNNEIRDAPGGPDRARGIDVQSKVRFSLVNENARIENNTITARDAGILLGGGAPGSVIRDNTVTIQQSGNAQIGIRLVVVRNVEVSGNTVTVLDDEADGILASAEGHGNLTVADNTIDGGDHGVRIRGPDRFFTFPSADPNNPVVVRANDVSNTTDDGIRVDNVNDTRLLDNTVTDPGDRGIVLNADELDVRGNRVTGGTNGIRVANSRGTVVADNRLDENDFGLNLRPGASLVSATGNVVTNGTTGVRVEGATDSRLRDTVVSNASAEEVLWVGSPANTSVRNLTLDSAVVSFEAGDVTLAAVDAPPADPSAMGNVSQYVELTELSSSAFANVTVTYTDAAAAGVNESTIALWRFDGSTWSVIADSDADSGTNEVSTNLSEFSVFAPLGELLSSTPEPEPDPTPTPIPTLTPTPTTTSEPSGGGGGGGSANEPPVAAFTVLTDAAGADAVRTDATVEFDASASDDPDGIVLSYEWDFDGDGRTDARQRSPAATHTYTTAGTFEASLTVVDGFGFTDATTRTVEVVEAGDNSSGEPEPTSSPEPTGDGRGDGPSEATTFTPASTATEAPVLAAAASDGTATPGGDTSLFQAPGSLWWLLLLLLLLIVAGYVARTRL